MIPHHETEYQQRVNNVSFCILGDKGFVHVCALITELMTASIAKIARDRRENAYSRIINIGDCKTTKKIIFAVKYLILIRYNYSTAKNNNIIYIYRWTCWTTR
jgi:hypothetical protein